MSSLNILLLYLQLRAIFNTKFAKKQQVAPLLLEATDIPEDLSPHLPFLSTSSPSLQ